MFRTTKSLLGATIEATDGKCGKCCDFLFDDRQFTIRYVVVDTGGFFNRNKVLLSPLAFREADLANYGERMPVKLSKQQIEDSPPIDEHAPVSREYEMALAKHYNHDPYWVGSDVWGFGPYPIAMPAPSQTEELADEFREISEHHLHSAHEIMSYQISAEDGDIGSVSDFIVETRVWRVRYFVVDTGSWLPGKKVLLAPRWEKLIRWEDKSVSFNLTREKIKNSPEFDPRAPVNVDYDGVLHDYYGVPQAPPDFHSQSD